MIEYNAIALCCCYAKSALSTETPSTTAAANRPSQHSLHCIKNLGGNVKFCPQETQKIRTNTTVYKPMFHAMSTGSLQGRLTLDAFIFKYLKNNPLFSKFSLNKHQSLNSDQFKPVSFLSEKVILTLF